VLLILVLGAGILAAIYFLRPSRTTGPALPTDQDSSAATAPENAPAANPDEIATVSPATDLTAETLFTNSLPRGASVKARPSSATNLAPAAAARRPVTAESRQLVQNLTTMFQPGSQLSPAQAGVFKEQLQQLVQQGAPGIPAILEFLDKNQDVMFGQEQARSAGYGSARAAMMDALRQIGGPEGIQGTLEVMNTTGDPREILALARNLETMSPGEHRQEMLEATRQTLAMARAGQLPGSDVGPLFEVLHQFGGANAIGDLEQATGQWKYYSAIGLANLPDGAGLPALIQMADGNTGNRSIALEMLAQVATTYPDARAALLAQVQSGKVAPNMWPYLGSVLGGDYYQFVEGTSQAVRGGRNAERMKFGHIGYGNQNFYQGAPPGGYTMDQIGQQIGLVNEMLGVANTPEAQRELARAKAALDARLARLAAVPPPQP
jgi:hypothetical protein